MAFLKSIRLAVIKLNWWTATLMSVLVLHYLIHLLLSFEWSSNSLLIKIA